MIWLFATPQGYWMIYFEAFTSGMMWAGAGIISYNFVLAIAPADKRQVYYGCFAAFGGIAMMISMLLSGAFLPKSMNMFGLHLEPEQVLFGLTGLVRWSTQIPLSWIHEPYGRPVSAALVFIREFSKVRIAQLTAWVWRKNDTKDNNDKKEFTLVE